MTLIHNNASVEAKDFLRKWVFGIWLCVILIDPFQDIAYFPVTFSLPTGFITKILLGHWYDNLWTVQALYGLKILLLISLTAVILNKFLKSAAVISCLLLTVHQGLVRSVGHIDHTGVLLLYAAYILTACLLIDTYYQKHESPPGSSSAVNMPSIPLVAILTVICFSYTFTGVHRLVQGGAELFLSDTILLRITESANQARTFSLNLGEFLPNTDFGKVVLKSGYLVTTIFEVFAPFCLVSRRFRYVFIGVILPFHIFIWLFMGILFLEQMLLFVLFFDISFWINKTSRRGFILKNML